VDAESIEAAWPIESVPDADTVFIRVHQNILDEGGGAISKGAFRYRDNGIGGPRRISCDWSKYSTQTECRFRATVPAENGVVSLVVGQVRALKTSLLHEPLPHNRSHAGIGPEEDPAKETEIRLGLSRIAVLVVHPKDPLA